MLTVVVHVADMVVWHLVMYWQIASGEEHKNVAAIDLH